MARNGEGTIRTTPIVNLEQKEKGINNMRAKLAFMLCVENAGQIMMLLRFYVKLRRTRCDGKEEFCGCDEKEKK